MGADDYVAKPFNLRELLARVRSVLRRGDRSVDVQFPTARQVYRFGGWQLDITRREVMAPSGLKIIMTGSEFDLLHVFCEHPNRILTRDQLIGFTHGPLTGPFERSIDTLISRLRKKLEIDPNSTKLIQTVRSEGYIFSTPVR